MRLDWATRRNLLHISMIAFALLIGRTPAWFISFMCFAAIIFNLIILPRITSNKIQKGEEVRLGFSLGLISYPASLLILSLLFHDYLVFMLIGWSMMAFGDGGASLIGRAWKHRFNIEDSSKSTVGSMGFLLLAIPMTFLLLMLTPAELRLWHDNWHWLLIISITAFISMLAERYEHFIDDNIAVSFTGATTAWVMHLIFSFGSIHFPNDALYILAAIVGLAALAFAFRAIDLKGATVGILIAFSIWLGVGRGGLEALFAFFLIGSLASRVKLQQKKALGFEAYRTAYRTWRNAVANAGPAAIMGFVNWLVLDDTGPYLTIGALTALSAALSDTLSSELGTPFGRKFIDLRSLKPSKPGPDGVFSVFGLLMGLLGAMIIPLIFYVETQSFSLSMLILIGGFLGNLIDTALGAWPQRMGLMNNHSVNFASTLIAGSLAAGYLFLNTV